MGIRYDMDAKTGNPNLGYRIGDHDAMFLYLLVPPTVYASVIKIVHLIFANHVEALSDFTALETSSLASRS